MKKEAPEQVYQTTTPFYHHETDKPQFIMRMATDYRGRGYGTEGDEICL
jgi:RimJ/RimL family protein N-acetyltransferase